MRCPIYFSAAERQSSCHIGSLLAPDGVFELSRRRNTLGKAAAPTTTMPREGWLEGSRGRLEKSDGKVEGHYRKRALPALLCDVEDEGKHL
ncbi:hypothetical protein DBV15_11043 [Temnothorax longispinosus]|uniref:Uncharacterized protein n=1 Tax=Temnothorax longispinosus TaxID=300112 RepID=A0A4S2KT47_9HYME|nr:hypothetical protein DBV15_11043 [Temnothorax longispinosus]